MGMRYYLKLIAGLYPSTYVVASSFLSDFRLYITISINIYSFFKISFNKVGLINLLNTEELNIKLYFLIVISNSYMYAQTKLILLWILHYHSYDHLY